MKKILLMIITYSSVLAGISQTVALRLFIENIDGKTDSITFGFNDNSTLGVDPLLDEKNIFGTPFDSLDIRIIQRDSSHFNCIREDHFISPAAPNLYFPDNIDTKTDFRPFGKFESPNNNFEIYIHARSYPIIIRTDFSGIDGFFLEDWSSIHLLNTYCNAIDTKSIFFNPANDTLFILTDSTYTTLVVNFQHEVSIRENEKTVHWTIFPNPTTQTIKISGLDSFYGKIEILDLYGEKLIEKNTLNKETLTVNIENISSGIYFVRLFNITKKTVSVKKFIKQ